MSEEKKNGLSEEEKAKLKEEFEEQYNRMGEVFSQCWESDEFKQAFIEDPKAIFEEYGINYEKDKEYRIIDTPKKTIIHVLPDKNIKKAVKAFTDKLNNMVEDLADDESKQILLEDWKWEIRQNTEDVIYLPIPLCPEELTPEELEMVNGGCLVAILVFIFQSSVIATTAAAAAEIVLLLATTVVAATDLAVALEVAELATVLESAIVAFVAVATTGAHVFANNAAVAEYDGRETYALSN